MRTDPVTGRVTEEYPGEADDIDAQTARDAEQEKATAVWRQMVGRVAGAQESVIREQYRDQLGPDKYDSIYRDVQASKGTVLDLAQKVYEASGYQASTAEERTDNAILANPETDIPTLKAILKKRGIRT